MTKEENKIANQREILIDLAQSCVQQLTHQTKGKLDWQVFNDAGDQIYTLDAKYKENQIFEIQDYAKHFELEAFNRGIQFMKEKKQKEIEEIKEKYDRVIKDMREENDKVVDKLNNYIGLSIEDDEEGSKIGIPQHMR